jgi:hypothetical protein
MRRADKTIPSPEAVASKPEAYQRNRKEEVSLVTIMQSFWRRGNIKIA